ncbi:hypothetical protein ACU8KH_05508 [Lachancea thermotolerans]
MSAEKSLYIREVVEVSSSVGYTPRWTPGWKFRLSTQQRLLFTPHFTFCKILCFCANTIEPVATSPLPILVTSPEGVFLGEWRIILSPIATRDVTVFFSGDAASTKHAGSIQENDMKRLELS